MLPSRFAIGDRVSFQLYETSLSDSFPAEVAAVTFDGHGKVLYDLFLIVNGEKYEPYPVRGVDSCFVQPTAQAVAA